MNDFEGLSDHFIFRRMIAACRPLADCRPLARIADI